MRKMHNNNATLVQLYSTYTTIYNKHNVTRLAWSSKSE